MLYHRDVLHVTPPVLYDFLRISSMTNEMDDFAITSFMEYLTIEKGCSMNTIKGYSHDLYSLVSYLADKGQTQESEVDWTKINLLHLRGFLAFLYNQRDNKTSSIHRRVCSVKAFFRYLHANKLIDEDPAADLQYPKRPSSIPKFLEVDSIKAIIDESSNPLHTAIIEVLYSTGARCNEVRNMNLEDVNFTERAITIRGGKGGKDRIVLLSERAAKVLKNYIHTYRKQLLDRARSRKQLPEDSDKAIFVSNRGTRVSNRTIQHFISKLSQEAGVKRTTPHMLRHSFASHLVMNNTNIRVVQQLLGHASLDTTQIYANITPEYLKSEFEGNLPLS